MDIIHQHEGVWYFWNETFDKRIGSYASKTGAEIGLEIYLQELEEEMISEIYLQELEEERRQIDGEN